MPAAAAATLQGAKIYGDGVWFKNNAAALTPEGANILGFGFGLGNNLPGERPWCSRAFGVCLVTSAQA